MNWEALGAIGEIVGAVAVIATLGYLAVQIRQNTQTVRLAALDSQQQYGASLRGQVIGNADVARIWRLGLQDYNSLGEDDQVRFRFLMYNTFFSHEFRFDHRRHGLIEPEFRERDDELLRFYFAQPGVRQWWETGKARFTRSFVEHATTLMQR
jgi:hypothetical protein